MNDREVVTGDVSLRALPSENCETKTCPGDVARPKVSEMMLTVKENGR